MFRRIVLPQSSGSESIPSKKLPRSRRQDRSNKRMEYCYITRSSAFRPLLTNFCLAYSSILKLEAVFSSETSVDFYRSTLRHFLDDSKVRYHILDRGQISNRCCIGKDGDGILV
jgi:hypothetical protein